MICIDDEPATLESLKAELRRVLGDNCSIETSAGGAEAVELLAAERGECEVALVLADYIVPDVKGDKLFKQIHQQPLAGNSKRLLHSLKIILTEQADMAALGNAIHHAKLHRYITRNWNSEDLKFIVLESIRNYLQDRS